MGSLQDTTSFLLSQCAFESTGSNGQKPQIKQSALSTKLNESHSNTDTAPTSPAQSTFSREVQELKSLLSRVRSGTFAKGGEQEDGHGSVQHPTKAKAWTGLGKKLLHDLKSILGLSGATLNCPRDSSDKAASGPLEHVIVVLKEGEVAIIQENENLVLSFPDISDLLKPI